MESFNWRKCGTRNLRRKRQYCDHRAPHKDEINLKQEPEQHLDSVFNLGKCDVSVDTASSICPEDIENDQKGAFDGLTFEEQESEDELNRVLVSDSILEVIVASRKVGNNFLDKFGSLNAMDYEERHRMLENCQADGLKTV